MYRGGIGESIILYHSIIMSTIRVHSLSTLSSELMLSSACKQFPLHTLLECHLVQLSQILLTDCLCDHSFSLMATLLPFINHSYSQPSMASLQSTPSDVEHYSNLPRIPSCLSPLSILLSLLSICLYLYPCLWPYHFDSIKFYTEETYLIKVNSKKSSIGGNDCHYCYNILSFS